MTMSDPQHDAQRQADPAWVQDQVVAMKAMIGRLTQANDQIQAAVLDLNEKLRDSEGRLREMTARTLGLPGMQEQLRQLSGLLDRIQDAEVLIDTKFEATERATTEWQTRDQAEKNDLYRRLQDVERRSEGLNERQGAVDDATRRLQDEISRSNLTFQSHNQRIEAVESKSARTSDAVTRLEQEHAETEQALRTLRREDDVLAERARLAHEVASRIETELHSLQEELRGMPLLAERVELLRAERQRLEDRTSHLEETQANLVVRVEREEEATLHADTRMKSYDARIDHVHTLTLDYRRGLTDQLLKLNQMLERMRRREVEEMERQVKELRTQQTHLKNDDDDA